MIPTGITLAWGLFHGRQHDANIARQVGLDQLMDDIDDYCLFLDPAFSLGKSTITQFRASKNITEEQKGTKISTSPTPHFNPN